MTKIDKNIVLFDDITWTNLLPLTFTRPVSEIRIGILKIREKWERLTNTTCSYLTKDYLSEKYPLVEAASNLLINGSILPDSFLINAIEELNENEVLVKENSVIAVIVKNAKSFDSKNISGFKIINYEQDLLKIDYPWDIFSKNGQALIRDYDLLTKGRKSAILNETNNLMGNNIFIEKGVKADFVTFNTTTGPIYLGKDTEIMEGTLIRGPFAMCEHSAVKLAAKIYGPTTLGPHVKVGGEINNSVIFGYSNKAHDGFLGNSVIGEWCNLGADTNNSNLKNNYAEVKLWNYNNEKFINTGLQFCGLIMGDHSKCGINTMFNTGTVVGVSANIFGCGFPRNFIPSFAWGGAQGFEVFTLAKAFEVAEKVMERRELKFDENEKRIMTKIFEITEKYRKF